MPGNLPGTRTAMRILQQQRSLNINVREIAAEWLGMTLFILIATGTATALSTLVAQSNGDYAASVSTVIGTAFAFGFSIAALVSATAHTSGGQLNPAITLGLVLSGSMAVLQASFNILAQIVGAILGSAIVYGMYPDTGGNPRLGANKMPSNTSAGEGFLGEMMGTLALVFVVLETAKNVKSEKNRQLAPLAIGFTVFIDHLFLIPFTSCSINPARSLGPAIVSGVWGSKFWVFIIAPCVGAVIAAVFHMFFTPRFDFVDKWFFKEEKAGMEASRGAENVGDSQV